MTWRAQLERLFPAHQLAAAADGVVPPSGISHRHGAALFADVRGFSAHMQRQAASGLAGVESLAASLHRLFCAIEEQVFAHGGDIQQFAGDSVLVLWLSAPDDDDALAAALAQAHAAADAIHRACLAVAHDTAALSVRIGIGAGGIDLVNVTLGRGTWRTLACGDAVVDSCRATSLRSTEPTLVAAAAWSRWCTGGASIQIADGFVAPVGAARGAAVARRTDVRVTPAASPILAQATVASILDRLDHVDAVRSVELRPLQCAFVQVAQSARLSQAQLSALAPAIEEVSEASARWGGAVVRLGADDKGVVLLVVWGVPGHQHVDGAARALAAMRYVAAASHRAAVQVRIGLASGLGVAAVSGGSMRFEYSVNGPAVNLAARLMQFAGADGSIFCDGETLDEAGVECERARVQNLPAEYGPVWAVCGTLSPGGSHERQRAQAGHSIADERSEVRQVLDSALAGMIAPSGLTVVVRGEAGIGKSTVAAAFAAQARAAGMEVIQGGADEVDAAQPYHMWRNVLRTLLGVAPRADWAAVQAAMGGLADPGRERDAALAALAGILSGDVVSSAPSEAPAEIARALRGVVRRLLAQRIERGPVLIVLEDMHWADSASRALARSLRATLPRMNLLVTSRADDGLALDAAPQGQAKVVRLELPSFNVGMVASLVARRLGVDGVDLDLARMIHEASRGLPLFADVLIQSLRHGGLLRIQGRRARLDTAPRAAELRASLPVTVRAAILKQVDELPSTERRVLRAASVLGQKIPRQLPPSVQAWSGVEAGSDLATVLPAALALGLLREEASSFTFTHALVRDGIYEAMSFSERASLHEALARWLDDTEPDEPSARAARAHHWLRTNDVQRAVAAGMQAGATAAGLGADREAMGWYHEVHVRLLAAPANHPVRSADAQCQRLLGLAACNVGQLQLARRHLAASFGNRRHYPTAGAGLWAGLAWQVIRLLGTTLRRQRSSSTPTQAATSESDAFAVIRLSEAAYFEWDTPGMLYAAVRGLADSRASGDRAAMALWEAGAAGIASTLRMPRVVARQLQRGMRIAAEVDRPEVWARVHLFSSLMEAGAGRHESALAQARRSIEYSRRCADPRRLEDALICHAVVQHQLGRFAESKPMLEECRRRGLERGDDQTLGWAYLGLGAAELGMGQLDAAAEALAMAEARVVDRLSIINLRGHLAVLTLRRDRLEEARDHAQAALAAARGIPTSFSVLIGLAEAARVLLELARRGAVSIDAFDDALAALRRFARTFPVGAAVLHLYRAHRLALVGSTTRAVRLVDQMLCKDCEGAGPLELGHARQLLAQWGGGVRRSASDGPTSSGPAAAECHATWLPQG